MKKSFNAKLKRTVYEIFAGDYFATKEKDVVLATLLGSCISVCMKDLKSNIVGINHFMLPSQLKSSDLIFSEDARYGISAMEKMINDMMKLGASRSNMVAKVFGGGKVLDTKMSNVAQSNVDFALAYLQMEDITIRAKNVGGNFGRKLFFFPDNFTVYVKKITYNHTLKNAVNRERNFLNWMQKETEKQSDFTLFNGKE